ncbi:Tyrosine recombinase XerD [Streptomyces sp. F-1]|nr:Tyrosine recombinase XerD [Streptomyces sp. F-1]
MPWGCARGRKSAGRIVHVIRVPAWVTDTVHGSARSRARRVSMRPSCSHSHASSGATASSAGEIERRAPDTQRSACGEPRRKLSTFDKYEAHVRLYLVPSLGTKRLESLGVAQSVGPRVIRLHDTRHGTATLLTAAGAAPRVVMEILGHSQISITMDVYTHVVQDTQREAMSHMDRLLRRRSGRP